MNLADFFQTAQFSGQPVMKSDYQMVVQGSSPLQLPIKTLANIYYAYFYTTRYVTQNFELNKLELADIKAEKHLAALTNQSLQHDFRQIVVEVNVIPEKQQVVLTFRHDG